MAALLTIIRTYWIYITLFLLVVITLLSLTPLPSLPAVPGSDKIQHFIAYGALMFSIALRKPKYWLWIAFFLISWSGVIELLQPYVNRYGDWMDMAANSGGVVCGILLAQLINWLFPSHLTS
jgi:VanZ family protein